MNVQESEWIKPLPVSGKEVGHIEDAIEFIWKRMRKYDVEVQSPAWFYTNYNKTACEFIDGIIATAFNDLRVKKIDFFSEKLFDRICRINIDEDTDRSRALGPVSIRLMDTMECIIAVKGHYRGKPFSSKYDKKTATEMLKARKLL